MIRKQMIRTLAVTLFAATPMVSHAIEIVAEGGFSITSASLTYSAGTSPSTTAKGSITYGVSAGYSLLPGFQIESGLMMLPRHYSSSDSSATATDVSFNSWMVPLMVRFTALPMVSAGAGLYYNTGTGQVSTTTTPAGGTASAAALSDFDSTGGVKKSSLGALASVRVDIPIAPLFAFVIDGRYLMDFSSRAVDTTQSLKLKDLQILTGVSFGF